jgi:outer membrane protein OmpA-like peptidoglycan-associated protein
MSKRGWLVGWLGFAAFLIACEAHRVKSSPHLAPPANTTATVIVPTPPSSSATLLTSASMTPVEQAVAQHQSAILQQRGVVAVDAGVLPDGSAAMFIEMCAEQAKKTLALPKLDVRVIVFVNPTSKRAMDKPCGCVFDGAYYQVGEGRKADCNSCNCRGNNQFMCTLLDCEVKIFVRISFNANSAVPSAEANAVYPEIVQVLRDKPELVLDVQGYADKGEKDPQGLSLRRAKAVYDRLIAAGAPRERLRGPTALGSTKPSSADNPELNRYVGFDVKRP